ncbi:hypothetical protein ABZ646_32925 [Streptomyces sp. NPDC007162]|uniref:hypothetical protein n=1 Tax=Streptomyces sp. NPDC007162 TaxID=3156917 RepID=UPI003402CB37
MAAARAGWAGRGRWRRRGEPWFLAPPPETDGPGQLRELRTVSERGRPTGGSGRSAP